MPLRTHARSGGGDKHDSDKHDSADPGPGRHVPFWLHQLVECVAEWLVNKLVSVTSVLGPSICEIRPSAS